MRLTEGELVKHVSWVLTLVAGFVLGWLWATKPELLVQIKWLDVMTAFGTCSAAIVAAWLGLRAVRQDSLERRARTEFASAMLAPVFVSCLDAVTALREVDPNSYRSRAVGRLLEDLTPPESQIKLIRDLDGETMRLATLTIRSLLTACNGFRDIRATHLTLSPEVMEHRLSVVKTHLKRAHIRLHRLLTKLGVMVHPLKA